MRILILSLFLVSCAGVIPDFSPGQTKKDKALVYVYRPDTFVSKLSEPMIYFNNRSTRVLQNKGWYSVELAPGKYVINARCEGLSNPVCSQYAEFHFEAGKSYYIKYDPTVGWGIDTVMGDMAAASVTVAGIKARASLEKNGSVTPRVALDLIEEKAQAEELKKKWWADIW